MAYLDIIIIEEAYQVGQDQEQYQSLQALIEASELWQPYFPAGLDVSAAVSNPDWYLNQEWYQELNITGYPVMLIAAGYNGQLLARLSGNQINASKILQTILLVTQLEYDQESGKYIYPDGSPVGQNGLLDTELEDGNGGGLISVGLPGFANGSWLALGLAALGIYKASKSNGNTQLAWGAAGAYGLFSYSKQLVGIGDIKSSKI